MFSKDMRKSPKKRIFPLSGLVQCAKCRENIIIISLDKQYFYYKCVNHQPGAGCNGLYWTAFPIGKNCIKSGSKDEKASIE